MGGFISFIWVGELAADTCLDAGSGGGGPRGGGAPGRPPPAPGPGHPRPELPPRGPPSACRPGGGEGRPAGARVLGVAGRCPIVWCGRRAPHPAPPALGARGARGVTGRGEPAGARRWGRGARARRGERRPEGEPCTSYYRVN